MNNYFDKVKSYLLELDLSILLEDEADGVIVVSNEEDGINNLVLGIADPLLIIEQFLVELKEPSADDYKHLLQKNRDIVHGSFVIDDSGSKVIFRDTLQLENLDLNEVEASFNSLSLLLNEYSDELIKLSGN
ncbi:MAG: YbjN domain-containing protein [Roseivirga sp.]|nr:YbjN domain-containing protein [Roseivirga sp.]